MERESQSAPRRVVLASRPSGEASEENFRVEEFEPPALEEGQVRVRVSVHSLDPYMRGRMDDAASYAAPAEVDGPMPAQGVGVVTESRSDMAVGTRVLAQTGWASEAVVPAKEATPLPDGIADGHALGALGMPGLTAWTGLGILDLKDGETLVLGAATGAVGSVAGQIAKRRGARVVGVAGGDEKCRYATQTLGYDACIDHRGKDARAIREELAPHCPDGINGYFENVGGATTEAVLPLMAQGGRIAICGMIAWYSGGESPPMAKVWRTILVRRLQVTGFLVFDHWHRMGEFHAEVARGVASGEIAALEHWTEGLEAAPRAFLEMLKGGNFGKTLVRV